jgi:GH18 family chitinase
MTKYTHINYGNLSIQLFFTNFYFLSKFHFALAFAILNTNATPTWTDPSNTVSQLSELVTAAHSNGVKVSISVGGWTGCIKYSATVASETNRQAFIAWNVAQIKNYNLDGVDLDWEYPG